MAAALPIEPDYALPVVHRAPALQTEGDGLRQRRKLGLIVEREWQLEWNALESAERDSLRDHWVDRLGSIRSFTWQPPNVGSAINVRFKKDEFAWSQTAEGYSAQATVVEVV